MDLIHTRSLAPILSRYDIPVYNRAVPFGCGYIKPWILTGLFTLKTNASHPHIASTSIKRSR